MTFNYYEIDTGAGSKTEVIARIISTRTGIKPNRILVVGCGIGHDAQALARYFSSRVDAIDVEDHFKSNGDPRVCFHVSDACALTFAESSFDLVYTFHALEHIPDWKTALTEIHRVLRSGGVYCVGTPNRTRVAGYVGVRGHPLKYKVRANLRDWGKRLRGRFRNEYGAHAGFSRPELEGMCKIIGPGRDIADDYYLALYRNMPRLMNFIVGAGLQRIAWPSVYVLGNKV